MDNKLKLVNNIDKFTKYFISYASVKNRNYKDKQETLEFLERFLDFFYELGDIVETYFNSKENEAFENLCEIMDDVIFQYSYGDYDITMDNKDSLMEKELKSFKERTKKEEKFYNGEYVKYKPDFLAYHLDGYEKTGAFLKLNGAVITYVDRDDKETMKDLSDYIISSSYDIDNIDLDELNNNDDNKLNLSNNVVLKHINADSIMILKSDHFILTNASYTQINIDESFVLKDGIPKQERKTNYINEKFDSLEFNNELMKINSDVFDNNNDRTETIRNIFNELIVMLEEETEVRKVL